MRPPTWNPPIELSPAEEKVAKRIRKAKLFPFLRQIRHLLFDEEFQQELATVFKDSTVGLCPVPPAQIALVIILQAYTGVSDDEAIEALLMDRRWQLVLDCLESEKAPFGKGTLVRFRAAAIAKGLDRKLIEKTVKMAEQREGFNSFQKVTLQELQIDRAYLTCHWVKERSPDLTIICKAWPVRHGQYFDKTAFVLDWSNHLIRCPHGVSLPFLEGQTVRFPSSECEPCPLRSQCTTSPRGRSVSIHRDESLLQELRQRQLTTAGRARLRERVTVEHCLAQIEQWQGDQARYMGLRKNLFDLRRMAVVHNLHVLAQLWARGTPRVQTSNDLSTYSTGLAL